MLFTAHASSMAADSAPLQLPCDEFSEFKEALQQARSLDDKIIYKLNTSVPTQSFADQINAHDTCKSLYEELSTVYQERKTAIQHCVDVGKQSVLSLRDKENSRDELRRQQTKLRLIQNEMLVEDIVRERSIKAFKERCWKSYKPPDLK